MNFILRFFNKKSIRIAELEKAAASHAREIGGHRASFTRLKKKCVAMNQTIIFILENNTDIILPPPTEEECAVDIIIEDDAQE